MNHEYLYKTFELLNSIYHILNGNLQLKSRTYGKDFFSDLELDNSKIKRVGSLLNNTRYMISWGYLTNLHQNWCKFKHLCNKYPLILNYAYVNIMLHKIIEQSQIIHAKNKSIIIMNIPTLMYFYMKVILKVITVMMKIMKKFLLKKH